MLLNSRFDALAKSLSTTQRPTNEIVLPYEVNDDWYKVHYVKAAIDSIIVMFVLTLDLL